MLKRLLLCLACLLPVSALAEPPETPDRLREAGLNDSTAWSLVEGLTTEVGARLAGTPAEARAAIWMVEQLKAMGFDAVWTQPFTLPGWTRGAEAASVTSPFPQQLAITTLGGSVATPRGGVEAPVTLFATFEDLLAAPAGSLAGRIAVVNQPTVRAQSGAGYNATYRNRATGASEAARRGAVAYLVRSLGTHAHRFPHTGWMTYAADAPRIPAAALSPPDADLLARMARRGKTVTVRLDLQPDTVRTVTSQNVIAELQGREKPEEIVLISAHLDSWDLGTGALDDGAGVAIVSAAGGLIARLPQRPRRTIRLVLFGAEEMALLGARAYAASLDDAAVSRHVIGSESDFGARSIWRLSTRVRPDALPGFAPAMTALAPLGIIAGNNTAHGGPDMGPLRMRGMPVFTLEQDGSDYFDFHHTADDTLDRIDRNHLAQNVAAWAVMTWWAAEDMDAAALRPIPVPAANRRPTASHPQVED